MKHLCLALFALMPVAVQAATCSATVSAVSFGTYQPTAMTANDSTGRVTVTCRRTLITDSSAAFSIALSAGNASYVERQLQTGTGGRLGYNVYTNSSRGLVWGDGSGGTDTVADSLSLPLFGSATGNYTSYGRARAGQLIPAGSYTDNLAVTITY